MSNQFNFGCGNYGSTMNMDTNSEMKVGAHHEEKKNCSNNAQFNSESSVFIFKGHGRIIHLNGSVFEGEIKGVFDKTSMERSGKLTHVDGSVFEGKFKGNVLNGQGYYENTREKCKGYFKNGLLHGKGVRTNLITNIVEQGEFKNDHLNGQGQVIWRNSGQIEKGTFTNGLLDGHGFRKVVNGTTYTTYMGTFELSAFVGPGVAIDEDNNVLGSCSYNSNGYAVAEIQ